MIGRCIAMLLGLGLVFGAGSAAANQFVVVASTQAAWKPGQIVPAGATFDVPAGGKLTLLGADGSRVHIRGPYRGAPAVGAAAADGVELIAIDPHAGNDRGPQEIDGFDDDAAEDNVVFNANLEAAGVRERVTHLRTFSGEALGDVDGPVDLLYIDGAHRFAPARDDIVRWGDKVKPGGELLIHDSFSSIGVTLALLVTLFAGGEFRYVGRAQSMTHYRREPVRGLDRVRNAARQAANLPWFLRNVLIKALILAKLGKVTKVFGHDPNTWPH